MKKKYSVTLFCMIGSFLSTPQAYTQDSLVVVTLSPRVGAVIDVVEQNYFQLFSWVAGFKSAVVLKVSSGNYEVMIERKGRDGTVSDTLLPYSEQIIMMMAERIEHFEALEDREYSLGNNPPHLLLSREKFAVPSRKLSAAVGLSLDTIVISKEEIDYCTAHHPQNMEPGRIITIIKTSGENLTGELIDIHPDEIYLSFCPGTNDDLLVNHPGLLIHVSAADVETLRANGHSNLLKDMVIGTAAGFGSGVIVGLLFGGLANSSSSSGDPGGIGLAGIADLGLIVGAPVGFIQGTMRGVKSSTSDVVILHPKATDLMNLKSGARYSHDQSGW